MADGVALVHRGLERATTREAGELDAKRAIKQGTEVAAAL